MANDFATCDLCDVHKGDVTGEFRVLAASFSGFWSHQEVRGPVEP
jgi:regulator of ribonuclease activity A